MSSAPLEAGWTADAARRTRLCGRPGRASAVERRQIPGGCGERERSATGVTISMVAPIRRSSSWATSTDSERITTSHHPCASGDEALAAASSPAGAGRAWRNRHSASLRTRARTSNASRSRWNAAALAAHVAARSKRSGRSNCSSRRCTAAMRLTRYVRTARSRPASATTYHVPDLRTSPSGDRTRRTVVSRSPVAHVDAPAVPHRLAQCGEEGHALLPPEPPGSIDEEPLPHPLGAAAQLRRQRGIDLRLCRHEHGAQPELARRRRQPGEPERDRLVRREPGEPRLVAVDELDAAARSALGVHGNAGLAQRLDVAVDRSQRHLQLLGQLRSRHPTAVLEQQEQLEEAAGAHSSTVLRHY